MPRCEQCAHQPHCGQPVTVSRAAAATASSSSACRAPHVSRRGELGIQCRGADDDNHGGNGVVVTDGGR